MSTAALRDTATGRRFRFDGVLLDEVANRLFVNGRERLCSQRAMRLLVVMCESAGQVLPKQRVIDKLWPGGQIVSDEALTQAVFRARACLDTYADRLVTVRGVGLRLDAEVRIDDGSKAVGPDRLPEPAHGIDLLPPPLVARAVDDRSPGPGPIQSAASAAIAPALPAATATASPSRRAATRHGRGLQVAGALLLLALILSGSWFALRAPPDPGAEVIDAGWSLTAADAHVAQAATLPLLREAFEHEGRGDRARAAALLETAHVSDRSTPLPAMYLALWASGSGDAVTSDRWLAQARTRVEPLASPLLTALLRYIEAERSQSRQDILRYAGAVLDQRNAAWQLRLARAHLLISSGLREAALKELSAISIDSLTHRKLAMGLADRASLGDPDGAEAIFARVAGSAREESTLAFLRGRFAWTRGDFPAAAKAFAEAANAAQREARFAQANRASVNVGVIEMLAGNRTDAVPWLERARAGMSEGRWINDTVDIALILAQLHALNGDLQGVEAELMLAEQAAMQAKSAAWRDLCKAFRARLLPGTPVAGAESESEAALAPILAAHAALHAGDRQGAREAWSVAERKVVPTSPLHDEVRWLAAMLGEPVDPPARIDPPFPPLARLTTRLASPLADVASAEPRP